VCKFRFTVHYSNDKNRWFLKKQGSGCATHKGHCHLDPKEVKSRSATLEEDEYKVVLEQLQANISIASIRARMRISNANFEIAKKLKKHKLVEMR
jgi:hypothetical protein